MRNRRHGNADLLQRLSTFVDNTPKGFSYNQVLSALKIKDGNAKQKLSASLDAMLAQGRLSVDEDGRYMPKRQGIEVEGVIDMTGSGIAYLMSPGVKDDIFIPPTGINHALHGDTVRVFVRQTKRRPEGEVIEIVKRARTNFVGILQMAGRNGFVMPVSRHMLQDIFVPADKLGEAQEGQKVIVTIEEWPTQAKSPIGRITDVLGTPGNNNTEMHAILAEYGLPYRFEPEVEQAASLIQDDIEPEAKHRRDFRGIPTLTIDPKDAKDFDDAISIRPLPNGSWEVGVHIADVSHYVLPGSVIDQEAQTRATSVYLVDRTVPMLPERLSNGLCSLRPNEDKLCYSAVFEMDAKAQVNNRWFGKTVIRSNHRFTYEEVQDVLDTDCDAPYKQEVLLLHQLAQQLRTQRFKNGSVGFERAEARFDIDKNGKPLGVYFREDSTSHQLIEELMLLANRCVAEEVGRPKGKDKPKTFVYRIHDNPNEEKLASLSHVALQLGHKVKFGKGKAVAKELNRLLDEVKGSREQNLLETIALRCMAKAEYSITNIGHYGLAFDYYTHFTSPIRRYPDIMVHRLLQHYLQGGPSVPEEEYALQCKHCSSMEALAANAERASIKYKMAEYMQDKVGMEFDGVISGVTEKGIYVEIIENKIEGMVMLRTMADDFYYFDEENFRVVGRRTQKTYTLGDKVRIKVDRVNMDKKQLDYVIVPGVEGVESKS